MDRKMKVLIIILVIVIGCLCCGSYYVNDYYHADLNLADYNNTGGVTIRRFNNDLLMDGSGSDTVLIFYPGAKVEYTAYVPLLTKLSERGVDCYLVDMPFNLAFLGKECADNVICNDSFNYSHYVLAGHSLGGVMASDYTSRHEGNVSALVLLAAYPADDINDIPVLSMYGTNDGVLNRDSYEKNKAHVKSIFKEHVINGANHAQFGSYGVQEKDGSASISNEEQLDITVHEISSFINTSF